MALCHECDSEVAENDVFCPFCGISLEPISLGGSASIDEFENTVAMSLPNKSSQSLKIPADPDKTSAGAESKVAAADDDRKKGGIIPADEAVATSGPPEPELLRNTKSKDIEPPGAIFSESHEAPTDPENIETKLFIISDTYEESGKPADAAINEKSAHEIEEENLDPTLEAIDVPVEIPSQEPEAVLAGPEMPKKGEEEPELLANADEPIDQKVDALSDDQVIADDIQEEELDPTLEAIDVSAEIPSQEPADVAVGLEMPKKGEEEPELLATADEPIKEDVVEVADDEIIADDIEHENLGPTFDAMDGSAESASQEPAILSAGSELAANREEEPEMLAVADEPIEENADLAANDEVIGHEDINLRTDPVDEPAASGAFSEAKVITNDFDEKPSTGDAEAVAAANSRTTPDIGGGDTDGKKSGLKPLSEGTVLNARYEIVRKIGGGGMGAVYLAFDKNLGGVERAVKEMVQLHIEEVQQQKAVDDFKRESMILSTLDHPSIPTIYDYFYDEFESRFYLVMKYISGGDLASRLRAAPGGRIDEKTVTEWALQIIDVLAYLHGLPTTIVYRDLKPSNVMIDGNSGRIMLIDFGIARSINQAQEKGVTAVGTMGYAPPELFSGNVEPRSDIYSLGSTMFHLLTGADPQNNPLLIFDFQKNPRPRQINPQLSDQMERILMRAVEYNADARFSTAAEMRQVLGDHLENLKRGNSTFGVTEIPDAVSLANQTVFCGFCGQRIVATDLFCAFCGAKQPIAQQGVHSEIYARSAPTAKLVIDGTSELDTPAFSLEKNDNLVGRRDPMSNIFPEVDLSKYDPQTKISRRHARIWHEGGNFMVEDLGSSNGTVLLAGISDSVRLVPHTPHTLANGDRLRVGDTTLHFLVG